MKTSLGLMTVALLATGCASSTGVMPMGPDTYIVSKQSGSPFKDPALLKAEAYEEATAFCGKKNKDVQLVSSNIVPGGFGHRPSAEVDFTCVDSGSRKSASE